MENKQLQVGDTVAHLSKNGKARHLYKITRTTCSNAYSSNHGQPETRFLRECQDGSVFQRRLSDKPETKKLVLASPEIITDYNRRQEKKSLIYQLTVLAEFGTITQIRQAIEIFEKYSPYYKNL